MNNYRRILGQLLLHAALATPCLMFGYYLLLSASEGFASVPRLLYGFAALLAGAVILAPPFARLVAEPSGELYYPERRAKKAPPIYSIPQSKVKKGCYEEALLDYEKILSDFPQEARAYVDMLEITLLKLRDRQYASSVASRAMDVIQDGNARLSVWNMYRRYGTILALKEKKEESNHEEVPDTHYSRYVRDHKPGRGQSRQSQRPARHCPVQTRGNLGLRRQVS